MTHELRVAYVYYTLYIQEVARCGITASARVAYQVEPRMSSLTYQICVGLYHSWPDNTIEIYTWYQLILEVTLPTCVSEYVQYIAMHHKL